MREIGGYFQLDQLIEQPYYKHLIELNTARNALYYLVKAKGIKKIYLPYFLCDSVSNLLDMYNVEYEYYNIDLAFAPILEITLKDKEYIYIVNYYGQITDAQVIDYKNKYKNIILDNVQSFFQKPVEGIDTIYSCRKYFGVPDGAYLSTDLKWQNKLNEDKSSLRMKHILGRFEGNASDYHADFRKNDALFKNEAVKKMSKLTKNILGAIDYELIIDSRNMNFSYLHENLRPTNRLELTISKGPFAYPYYVKDGLNLRKKLAEKKIYIPTLWPNVLMANTVESVEYDYAANILPIPCDQRYEINDMEVIIKELTQCIH